MTAESTAMLWTEDELNAMLEEMGREYAPQVFTVFQVAPGLMDARIYAWGMDFGPDESCWFHTVEGSTSGTMTSPETLVRRLCTFGDFRLVRVGGDPDQPKKISASA
jgi:NAD(P)-dependent dehydrogenase (short-subunit alcohol dehydrogenase family)